VHCVYNFGRSRIVHVNPGMFLWLEYTRQVPDAIGGVLAFSGLPHNGYFAVGIFFGDVLFIHGCMILVVYTFTGAPTGYS